MTVCFASNIIFPLPLFNFSLSLSPSLIRYNIFVLQSFDRGFVYNSCFPPIEIPHWFEVRSDKREVRFRLSRKWYNRDTRMGLALCALFEVDKDVTDVDYIVNSKNSYSLICHLENKIGSVKPRHIYWPTQQHLMLSQLGGFIWLSYIPHGSFPDWLYDCDYVTVSFTTNCFGLTAQKCGLRPLYQHDDEEDFKKIINLCENSVPNDSLRIIENRERITRSQIENELRQIDLMQVINNNEYLPCLNSQT
jgi:hypothetical protein